LAASFGLYTAVDDVILHAAQIVELARRLTQLGQKIQGQGGLPLPRLETDGLIRRQRGQLIELPAKCLVIVAAGPAPWPRIEPGEAFGWSR